MKKLILSLLAAGLCFAGNGCIGRMVPKTTISGYLDGQPFALTSPKDSKITGLKITAQSGGLTNYVSISIESLEARMNPEVITTTADGQVKMINAVADGVIKGIGATAGAAK